jgi:hypothetical protein
MKNIYDATSTFCGNDFSDDVTILVVKCNFDTSSGDYPGVLRDQ